MSMHLLHRLSGQGADPTGAPTEYSGTEQCPEESWDGVLEPSGHHPDSSEDEAAETDDGTRINRKGLEGSHECLRPGEVHRSLGLCDVRSAGECESKQGW